MESRDTAIGQRGVNRVMAGILSRVICPEQADWSEAVAREFLSLNFPEKDRDRFHGLLAGHYGDRLTEAEGKELESYLLVNYLLVTFHDRARRSLDKAKVGT